MALVVEFVSGGLLVLGPGDYLDRLHVGFLVEPVILLHLPSFLLTSGGWAERLAFRNHDAYIGIVVSLQWVVWLVVFLVFLLVRSKHSGNTFAEPDGPANGSQPIRSETNRTSSAAGSRR
jgi:hypothetical protein